MFFPDPAWHRLRTINPGGGEEMLKRTRLLSIAIAVAGAFALSTAYAADRPKAAPGSEKDEASGIQSPKDLGDTKKKDKMARPKSKPGSESAESSGAQSTKDLGSTKDKEKMARPKAKPGRTEGQGTQ